MISLCLGKSESHIQQITIIPPRWTFWPPSPARVNSHYQSLIKLPSGFRMFSKFLDRTAGLTDVSDSHKDSSVLSSIYFGLLGRRLIDQSWEFGQLGRWTLQWTNQDD